MHLKRKIREKTRTHLNAITGNIFVDTILQNRGVSSFDDMSYDIHKLLPPWDLVDIDLAVHTIIRHIKKGSHIVIVGDYDCDGATSTTIAVEGLQMCGAKQVSFVVPDRRIHGYGLTPSIVKDIEHLSPDLLVTVDNGVSSFDGANAVKEYLGDCELVVTDHHLASPDGLPDAAAIVNPNRNDCQFPSKNIAGCGVIFYVIMALRARMREQGLFNAMNIPYPNLKRLMDVLAVGTVADLVTLDINNRNIVSIGIGIINQLRSRPGIAALAKVSGQDPALMTATDIAFKIAPRINAAGRMADMTVGIRCLLSRNFDEAMQYAKELDQLNVDRKNTQTKMMEEADAATNFTTDLDGVTVYQEDWHEGVIGILASQIKEKVNRPVICFTKTEPEEGKSIIKGSARSVPGIHLKHILDEIKVNHPHILKKFGGHAMAAGLSLEEEHYAMFSKLFNQYISKHMTEDIREGVYLVDIAEVPASSLTLQNAKTIEQMGPWGQNFELPTFAGTFNIVEHKVVGAKHLKMVLEKDHARIDAIAFNCIDEETGEVPYAGRVKVIFTLDINRWQGRESLQMMVSYIEPCNIEISKTENLSKEFVKKGAGRQNRDMSEACKLFDPNIKLSE